MRFGMSRITISSRRPLTEIPLAWRVIPRNYLLFACHATNASAQTIQDARFVNYWYMGGKDKSAAAGEPKGKVLEAVEAAREEAKKVGEAK